MRQSDNYEIQATGKTAMTQSFDFITSEELRTSLIQDMNEINVCHSNSAWKAVHVLSGSVIEALLIDTLIAEKHVTETNGHRLTLARAIDRSQNEGIISQKSKDLASVVRCYRNLIHPGYLARTGEQYNKETAEISKSLVSIIISEVEKRRKNSLGYTGEQIANKLYSDPTARSILSHLLKSVSENELIRLMTEVLPYELENSCSQEFPPPEHLDNAYQGCFHAAFEKANDDSKEKVTEWFVKLIKEEGNSSLLDFAIGMFRISYLENSEDENKDVVKKYLLHKLKERPTLGMLESLRGVGVLLQSDEVSAFIDPIVSEYIRTSDGNYRKKLLDRVQREGWKMSQDITNTAVERFETWIAHFNNKIMDKESELVGEIKQRFEMPF